MKAALVYTSTTPELIELVEKEVKECLGEGAELISYQDPNILADVILMCQGSMAFCEKEVEEATGLPTLSSPAFGARALRQALEEKGVWTGGSLC